jgi:hypothetical protein
MYTSPSQKLITLALDHWYHDYEAPEMIIETMTNLQELWNRFVDVLTLSHDLEF